MTQVASAEFNVARFIDERPLDFRTYTMLIVCTFVLFVDGFDTYFLGKIAPAVAEGLGGTPADMAPVFTLQQVGMAIGAFLMPPLADKIGRKPVLALCLAIFGVLAIWAVFASDLTFLGILRGISGVFFSAMLPITMALLSEITPRRHRASFMAIALVGFSGGSAASGIVAAWLLDIYGWQVGFWLGGILPLASLPLLLLIPESVAFRVARNPADPKIPAMLRRLDPSLEFAPGQVFTMGPVRRVEKSGPMALFQPRYRLQTAIMWCACFLALGNIALLANWMPTYFQELGGIPIQEFAVSAMIAFAGGAMGTLTMGWLLDRVNPYWLISGFFLVDAAALILLGVLPFGTAAFLAAMIIWNYSQVGGQTGINTLATLGYPAQMRSTGIGWAGGSGRIGGIAFPYAGGLALTLLVPLETIMLMVAAPAIVIAVLIFILGIVNKGQIAIGGDDTLLTDAPGGPGKNTVAAPVGGHAAPAATGEGRSVPA